MYLRRCKVDLGAFRLIFFFWEIEIAADSLYPRRVGCSNVSVAVSLFAPPRATVGVAMGYYFVV